MRLARRPALAAAPALLAVLVLLACSPKRIAGTDIQDTEENRAVVATIDAYRKAAERRDANGVLALVSPKYYDDAGTPDPGDDLDYDLLRKRLGEDYRRITVLRLDIGVKRIDVKDDRAFAYVFYDQRYRIRTGVGEIAKQGSDIHRMQLLREDGVWRFVSGL
jgi:hypothetical protein